tara:strand:- start:138 stop:449 length:312 start_codon:yes stop_codon:yes gene_type:complete
MNIDKTALEHILELTVIIGQAPSIDFKSKYAFWQGVNYHDLPDHLLSLSWAEKNLLLRLNPYAHPFQKENKYLRHTIDGYCTYWDLTLSELDLDEIEQPKENK